MPEVKKIELDLDIPAHQAELFRTLLHNLNYQDFDDPTRYTGPYGVEILAEEPCELNDEPHIEFSLWFDRPATAYWFAGRLHEAKQAWHLLEQAAAQAASYPRFLYKADSRTWLRYNSPTCFCLVNESQLQVRREQPQQLWLPEQVVASSEADFLAAYHRTRAALLDHARQYLTTYQRRGAPGNEWFYANPIYAATTTLPLHLRLNASDDAHGRTWQLMWAPDTRRHDPRRVGIEEPEFTKQLEAMLADVEAVATGKQEGGVADA